MTWILIIVVISTYNGAPAITSVEFSSKSKCQDAMFSMAELKNGFLLTCVKK